MLRDTFHHTLAGSTLLQHIHLTIDVCENTVAMRFCIYVASRTRPVRRLLCAMLGMIKLEMISTGSSESHINSYGMLWQRSDAKCGCAMPLAGAALHGHGKTHVSTNLIYIFSFFSLSLSHTYTSLLYAHTKWICGASMGNGISL